ncbi:MAG: hypothetical protein LAT66_14850 [Alkalimonas sp.]|nr:hypothetical protein [Alkalimonas sp.]
MLLSTFVLLASSLSADDFTTQQRSLLQAAVNAQYLSHQLSEGYTACKQSTSATQWSHLHSDLQSYPAADLIEQALAIPAMTVDQFTRTLALQPNRSAAHWVDIELTCDDTNQWQQLFSDYRAVYFELELSPQLEHSFADSLELLQQSKGLQQQRAQAVIDESNSIAIASTVQKSQLSAIEQANYLHIEYQSDYIFRVQRGWKNYPPLYLGMHRYMSAAELTNHEQQWLIFLDHQQHFISAVPLTEAHAYLELLGAEHWSFDRHGNLNRNP